MFVSGVKRATGNYNGNDYDNMMIHCHCINDGSMLCGDPVDIVKIKTPIFNDIIGRLGVKVEDLVGKHIRVYYNKYGAADGFDILK